MDLMKWMRHFTIRTRMQGAIAMVLGMFALVGLTGLFGGQQLKSLNTAFMDHSIRQLTTLAQIRASLAEVRLWEKEMVINYEDGVTVLKARERWQAASAQFEAALAQPQYRFPSRTLLARGVCEARAGQLNDAERSLAKAFELEPANPAVSVNLAEVLLRLGQLDRARFYVRRVNALLLG